MPLFHNIFNSSIKGCKYTSILDFGLCEPGITDDKNMYGRVMHMCGGKLYTQTTVDHTEYGLAAFEYRLNPSAHNPSQTLRASAANEG